MSHVPRRKACGFTLVELLVVIGIIALLVGILLPTLNRARQSAQATVCLSNQRSIGQSIMLYGNDNDGLIVLSANRVPPPTTLTAPEINQFWHLKIKDYLSSGNAQIGFEGGVGEENQAAFVCPAAGVDGGFHHYSPNPAVMHYRVPWWNNNSAVYNEWWQRGQRMSRVNSEKIMLSDGIIWIGNRNNADAALFHLDAGRQGNFAMNSQQSWMLKEDIEPETDTLLLLKGPNRDQVTRTGGESDPLAGHIRWRHGGKAQTSRVYTAADIASMAGGIPDYGTGIQDGDDDNGDTANFLFADGHASAHRHGSLRVRNMRVQ